MGNLQFNDSMDTMDTKSSLISYLSLRFSSSRWHVARTSDTLDISVFFASISPL